MYHNATNECGLTYCTSIKLRGTVGIFVTLLLLLLPLERGMESLEHRWHSVSLQSQSTHTDTQLYSRDQKKVYVSFA